MKTILVSFLCLICLLVTSCQSDIPLQTTSQTQVSPFLTKITEAPPAQPADISGPEQVTSTPTLTQLSPTVIVESTTTPAPSTLAPISPPPNFDGLICYYLFNGDSKDESANGLNGIVHGATPTADRFGNSNGAFFFDGVNDYIDFGNDSRFNIVDAITLATWVNPQSFNDWSGILSKGIWAGPSPYLSYALDTKQGGYFKFTLRWGEDTVVSKQHQTNTWYHVVGTWNGKEARIYVNGILENQGLFTGNLNTNNGILTAGVDHPGVVEYFNGSIDEIRVYDHALSEEEIRALYDAEKP